jgi:hypothetical protein
MSYLVGNDGGVVLGDHFAQFNAWNGTFSRQVSDITGFSDAGRRRRLGVWDANGSAGGFLRADATSTGPGVNTADWQTGGSTIYLHAKGSGTVATNATGVCTMILTAVISEVAMSVAKTGDAAVSFNWALAGGAIPIELWDET